MEVCLGQHSQLKLYPKENKYITTSKPLVLVIKYTSDKSATLLALMLWQIFESETLKLLI